MPKFKDGKIILEIPQECELCGIEFETTSTKYHENKEDPEWCERFGCCTQDCLERFYNYDEFKVQYKYRVHTGLTTRDMRADEWSTWIKAKIFEVNPAFMSLYDQFQTDYGHFIAEFKMDLLVGMGLNFDKAKWLSDSDISDNIWATDKEWGFCEPGDEPDYIVGW